MTRFLFIEFMVALAVFGQSAPKPGGTTPVTTPTTGPSRTTTPTTQPTDQSGPMRTIFISGKVVLEDGTPPPEAVVIERSCGTTRRAETRTDLKGHFSFQIGGGANNTEQLMDASSNVMTGRQPSSGALGQLGSTSTTSSANRNGGNVSLSGCDIRAVLAGYRSSSVTLSMRSEFDNPDIGMIILKRLGGREGDTISMTNALAPKDAKKAFDKSRVFSAKGNTVEAQKELSKAVDIYPKYASAWAELGRLQMEAQELPAARKSFEKSLEADPKYLPPYERLAVLAMRDRNWHELVDKTDQLIKLNAYDFPQAYYYNAIGNLNLGKAALAEKSARFALKQDPQKFSRAGYVLGLALAQQGEYSQAVDYLRAYQASGPSPNDLEILKPQLAEIEKQATKQVAAQDR